MILRRRRVPVHSCGRILREDRTSPPECDSPATVVLGPVEYQTPVIEDRAVQVHMLLADRGQQRAVIASVTGQPVERLELPLPG